MKGGTALHQRLQFDTARGAVLDEQRRYLLAARRCADGAVRRAAAAAARSGAAGLRPLGRHAWQRQRARLRCDAGSRRRPLAAHDAKAPRPSLGWGRWQLTREAAELRLQVDAQPVRSPARARAATPVCHAIAGMLQRSGAGASDAATPSPPRRACAAEHGGTTCRFVTRSRADFTVNQHDGDNPMKSSDSHRLPASRSPPALPPARSAADLKVGLSVSLSGPNSSLGVPYAKGMQAALAYKPEINGRKVAAHRARRRLRPDHRRPQRAQADRGRQGRRASWAPRACRRRSRWRRSAARRRRR